MTKLSVNVNKIATLRNSRGGNNPNLLKLVTDIERFGADGITVHPRPDERHIRYSDVIELKDNLNVELNIEGNPLHQPFVDLILKVKPHQITLVPDSQQQLTSDNGWNLKEYKTLLREMVTLGNANQIKVSIFINPDFNNIEELDFIKPDRLELYTYYYALYFSKNPAKAIFNYIKIANFLKDKGFEINAGHDLSLENLTYFSQQIPFLNEVSIGHALICDALYFGIENTINLYKRCLK